MSDARESVPVSTSPPPPLPVLEGKPRATRAKDFWLGVVALFLCLAGIGLFVVAMVLSTRAVESHADPSVGGWVAILSFIVNVLGCIMGVVARKSGPGKAACIVTGVLLAVSVAITVFGALLSRGKP